MKGNSKKWINADNDSLFKAILSLKNLAEARRFFRDLLTEEEIREFSMRWKAAKMLNENRSYSDIGRETWLSSRTIARIKKWLTNGMNGYKLVIDRLGHTSASFGKR